MNIDSHADFAGTLTPDRLDAADILAAVGPRRFLHFGGELSGLADALRELGGGAAVVTEAPRGDGSPSSVPEPADVVIVDRDATLSQPDLSSLFRQLRPLARCALIVRSAQRATEPSPARRDASRTDIETAAFAAGYRRHPAAFELADFYRNNLADTGRPVFLETIPVTTLEIWPLERLAAERDLHMDMTRESGPRSDAHLVRYALAAEWIRPGDAVLDCACGLGYGTAVLAARSDGARVLGVDLDAGSIAYAQDNFGDRDIAFRAASATRLDFVADRSMDVVVSFETLEHLDDYGAFLNEAARVLKPDGRIIVSVPNLWIDETGKDPNPHHFHVFDYGKCRTALEGHFSIEARYAQTAPGGTKLLDAPRHLRRLPMPEEDGGADIDTEWWIVVASAHSTGGEARRDASPAPQERAPDRSPHRAWRRAHTNLLMAVAQARDRECLARLCADAAALQSELRTLRLDLERQRRETTLRSLLPQRIKEVLFVLLPRALRRLFGLRR